MADGLAVAMDERLAKVEELEERRIEVRPDLLRLDLRLRQDFRQIAGRGMGGVRDEVGEQLREAFPALCSTSTRRGAAAGSAAAGAAAAWAAPSPDSWGSAAAASTCCSAAATWSCCAGWPTTCGSTWSA